MVDLQLWHALMKPHPPPYLTLEELERHHGCPEDDQEPFSDGTADYDEVTEYARDDLIIDDLIIDDTADYTEETEFISDDVIEDDVAASSKDAYLEEFNAFYANYEAGAQHMYYEAEQDDVHEEAVENDGYEAYGDDDLEDGRN